MEVNMKVDYELKKKDYIDFNVYHMKNSDAIKKSMFLQRFILPISFLIIPYFISRVTEIPLWYWIAVFAVTAVIWVVFYEKYLMTVTMKRVSKMIDEGNNKDLLGKHSIIVDEEGLVNNSNNSENKIKWSGVERIVSTEEHFFIYVSSISAYIIPKSTFESDDSRDMFFQFVSERIAKNCK